MEGAIMFMLRFSCTLADLPELSDYYIEAGATEATYVDDLTFNGKWQINVEPRRLYPDPASGAQYELLAKLNVFDPDG